jgi:hypothetical protein
MSYGWKTEKEKNKDDFEDDTRENNRMRGQRFDVRGKEI